MFYLALLVVVAAPATNGSHLILNEDNSHFFAFRSAGDMTPAGLNAFVDQYAGTRVTHLFLNPNAMRTSYASSVWDTIWDTGQQDIPKGDDVAQRWVDNAKLLNIRGLDPYAVWITRCREKGISPWITMRMNDIHNVDNPKNYQHSTFWVKHLDYWRVPGSTNGWTDRALDYGIPEVRERSMELIKELLERYDPDGLELDWMRFGYHFKSGKEVDGCDILTAFMTDVRKLCNAWSERRGHKIEVSARVPAHPDAAVGLGMDGVTWARGGLIDILVPTPFWATADFDIPADLWQERIGVATIHVEISAGIEILLGAYPGAKQIENDIETVRGCAAEALARGADSIYLFNYMDPAPMQGGPDAYRELLAEGLTLPEILKHPRKHVITYHDTVPASVSAGVQLPKKTTENPAFRINIGPALKTGSAVFTLGLSEENATPTLAVEMNGQKCSASDAKAQGVHSPDAKSMLCFTCPLPALRDGYNEFHVRSDEQNAATIVWVDLRLDPAG